MRRALSWLTRTLKALSQLPDWLNWLLSVVEPLVVLAIAFLLGYSVYMSIWDQGGQQTKLIQLMKVVNDNWKAALILFVILFYRTVRVFLEQAEEGPWGFKKKSMQGDSQAEPNPPGGAGKPPGGNV